jgi:hypothetical protein
MLFIRPNWSRKFFRPVKPFTPPARRNAARLRLEALDERVVPAFLDAVNYAAGFGPQAVVTGDFNNDAVLDLAVSNYGSETVNVLLGNGDGTFRTAISSPAGNGANSLAVGDFNADGKLDLATDGYSNSVAPDTVVTVLYGEGDGTFPLSDSTVLSYFSLTFSTGVQSLLAGDFDGDGYDDLAAVTGTSWVSEDGYSSGSYTDVIGLVGGGTWAAQSQGTPYAAVVGDFDGYGTLDVATVTSSSDGYVLNVALGNWGGQLGPTLLDIVGYPTGLTASDLNNDGKVDLAVSNSYGSVDVLLGTGTGSFGSPQSYATGSNPSALAAADFNGDGVTDLITTNGGTVNVLLGTGTGALKPPVTAAVGSSSGVAVGDFNGDGLMDAATAGSGVSVLINDGEWDGSQPPPPPVPSIAIGDVTVTEGNTGSTNATFTVSLSATSSRPVTVRYTTADGTATAVGGDYQASSDTLTFAPGETSKTITVAVIGDRIAEPNEMFSVRLGGPTNAVIADSLGLGTILDEEPRVSITDVTRGEGNTGQTAFAFTVTLSTAYDLPVTVAWTTADGTAAAGSDYQAANGTLTFAPGETSKTVTVLVNGDRVPEPNTTFFVNLSNPNYGAIADGQGVGTIRDDEPRISIGDATKREGRKNATHFTFTVTLSVAYDQAVTVSFATANGSATAADGDYVARTGTLTFAPGETSKTITITVQGDSKRESNETFYLDLFGLSSNALFTKNRGLGAILNDD